MAETRTTLLRRVRDPTDADAWREFVTLYRPLLRAYVLKKGLAGSDADDVVQEVLVRLLKALPGFELARRRARFRTWLWTVTSNALADGVGCRRRRDAAELAHAVELPTWPAGSEEGEPEADWVVMH